MFFCKGIDMYKKLYNMAKMFICCVIVLLVNIYGANIHTINAADLPSIELNTESIEEEHIIEDNVDDKKENTETSKLFEYIIISVLFCIAVISIVFNVILIKRNNEMSQYQKKIDNIKNNFDTNLDKYSKNVTEEKVKSVEVRKRRYSEVSSTTMLWKVLIQIIDVDRDIVYEASFNNTDDNKKITVGRGERGTVDIKIALPNISDKHCEIIKRGDKYYLKDLASTNGTKYDGVKVNDIILLKEKGIVHLGKSHFELIIKDK